MPKLGWKEIIHHKYLQRLYYYNTLCNFNGEDFLTSPCKTCMSFRSYTIYCESYTRKRNNRRPRSIVLYRFGENGGSFFFSDPRGE